MIIRGIFKPVKDKTQNRLKQFCGALSPTKRWVTVLVACVMFATIDIFFLCNSVKNIGKNDKKKGLMKIEHIEVIKIQKNDSINLLKQKNYEYE